MIQEFVDRFMSKKFELEEIFTENHPNDYSQIVEKVITIIQDKENHITPNVNRIHKINDGHCSGTLLHVIAAMGHQPYKYWYVKVDYGSCSVCDTLQKINRSNQFNEKKVKDYMMLALHIVQSIKLTGGVVND